ncbi:hypothetical protein C5167_038466 [Papaver somniferum]|uniref:Uncharacterized protein n=1 Tax=Papaver somniferum TaxID=3469 RepID=A0A4Y7ICI8_PAPSO|nr:hypothetical protein C5167_038466 [Papaver somniferum]
MEFGPLNSEFFGSRPDNSEIMASDSCIWSPIMKGSSQLVLLPQLLEYFPRHYPVYVCIREIVLKVSDNGWSITKVVLSSDNTILKQNTILTKTSQSQLGVSASTHCKGTFTRMFPPRDVQTSDLLLHLRNLLEVSYQDSSFPINNEYILIMSKN